MLRINVFGTTTATLTPQSKSVSDLGGAKPRQILEILVLADGRPVPKDRLGELLWGSDRPRSWVGTLESYVSLLRRRLGCTKGRTSAISTTKSGYLLDLDQVSVDLHEVRSMLSRASFAVPASAVRYTLAALELAESPLLASEPYADWAVRERETLAHELVEACVHASAQASKVHDVGAAITLARTAVRLEPIAEDACRQLMRALWSAGRRGEALRCYHDLRDKVLEELAVEPGEPTQTLYLEILRDEAPAQPVGEQGATELRTLLGLLRQTLDAIPGVEPTLGDSGLSYAAVKALSAG